MGGGGEEGCSRCCLGVAASLVLTVCCLPGHRFHNTGAPDGGSSGREFVSGGFVCPDPDILEAGEGVNGGRGREGRRGE